MFKPHVAMNVLFHHPSGAAKGQPYPAVVSHVIDADKGVVNLAVHSDGLFPLPSYVQPTNVSRRQPGAPLPGPTDPPCWEEVPALDLAPSA